MPDVQENLEVVKEALREGKPYNGIQGDALVEHFLALNEKENLLLSHQLSVIHGEQTGPCQAPHLESPVPFDRGDLGGVLAHLNNYEMLSEECIRALRALASLTYADAAKVGADDRVLEQVMKISAIHAADVGVQLAVVKVVANLAYDTSIAVRKLTGPKVLDVLLGAMVRFPAKQEIAHGAGEALARVVFAETQSPPPFASTLPSVFAIACRQDRIWQKAAAAFAARLIANEVTQANVICNGLMAAFPVVVACASDDAKSSILAWLLLIKDLVESQNVAGAMAQALVEVGAIAEIVKIMEGQLAISPLQPAGAEILVALVNNSGAQGLSKFSTVNSLACIELAMKSHINDSAFQILCIRFFTSCLQWHKDVQTRAGYNFGHSVDLIKLAMMSNIDSAELQATALEALSKYVDKLNCYRLVKLGGGEGLVKAVLARHTLDKMVQTWGKILLDAIGVDRLWVPKNSVASEEDLESSDQT